ncbi:hypothetical protein BKA67DRAFT_567504 [Truncatella angustata]|uniref:Uncharacterized protein n=1 Tax=Truncatella angustata TaxID=152316 RepID=A0A9P8ZW79_9PEZI|nr:uncharacterized protein BKA67DRAFT_567504 [Truncatella angustata]KAH6652771.1 hypothetical protein BKA67DRAFT_567504 [Truncatella angustata]
MGGNISDRDVERSLGTPKGYLLKTTCGESPQLHGPQPEALVVEGSIERVKRRYKLGKPAIVDFSLAGGWQTIRQSLQISN